MICEICDRAPEHRGRGWVVMFTPGPNYELIADAVRVAAGRQLLCYTIFTCGSEVCRHRAHANGVPGRVYPQFREMTP